MSIFKRKWGNCHEPSCEPTVSRSKHDAQQRSIRKKAPHAPADRVDSVHDVCQRLPGLRFRLLYDELEESSFFSEAFHSSSQRHDRRGYGNARRADVPDYFSVSASQAMGLARQAGKFAPLA